MSNEFSLDSLVLTKEQKELMLLGYSYIQGGAPQKKWSFQPYWMYQDLSTGETKLVNISEVPVNIKNEVMRDMLFYSGVDLQQLK